MLFFFDMYYLYKYKTFLHFHNYPVIIMYYYNILTNLSGIFVN